jgi:PPOX class probable F420-dependent enzyme
MLIPETHLDLLRDEKRAFAVLATSMPDGSPQASVVWFDMQDDLIRVNTARGRVKDRNMMQRPNVALVILDPADPYRCLQVRGAVVDVTEQGAREHIDHLANKYLGQKQFPWHGEAPRVIFFIRPDHVSSTE